MDKDSAAAVKVAMTLRGFRQCPTCVGGGKVFRPTHRSHRKLCTRCRGEGWLRKEGA